MFSYLPFPIQQAAGRAWDDHPNPADRHRRELARVLRAAARGRRRARSDAALTVLSRFWRPLLPVSL